MSTEIVIATTQEVKDVVVKEQKPIESAQTKSKDFEPTATPDATLCGSCPKDYNI